MEHGYETGFTEIGNAALTEAESIDLPETEAMFGGVKPLLNREFVYIETFIYKFII